VNPLKKTVGRFSEAARRKRGQMFRERFELTPQTRILDLGSESGGHIASVLDGADVTPSNVFIADIDEGPLREGQAHFGFTPVVIPESGRLPFPDRHFDVVFCSSVIEHVTLPKAEIWNTRSGREFRRQALARQSEFAREIMRLGKAHFVQTPYRWFPIESHTQLPFVGWFPRRLLLPTLGASNRFWFKATAPDWNLLGKSEMQDLFPDSVIVSERFCGLTKSIMAVGAPSPR
jgi:SAM-dependent methyltransferase